MKVLVLVQDYPDINGKGNLMYVHVRSKYYIENRIDVTVLNFNAAASYVIEQIPVITLQDYKNSYEQNHYDKLICHAANLRSHYKFLMRYGKNFPKFIFFFHGHEVLSVTKEYPEEYTFVGKSSKIYKLKRNIYDRLKFLIWRSYFKKVKDKSQFVFVSQWIKEKFYFYLGINPEILDSHSYVINNSVGKVFETETYVPSNQPEYDFVTIRSNMDSAKYCVDLINEWAKSNPKSRFLLIGKGTFFGHYPKSDNITWIDKILSHNEILSFFNRSRCALLPTRHDTQGVMTCEAATYGMPVITSDIPICEEIFSRYPNVELISNENKYIDLERILSRLEEKRTCQKLYCAQDTLAKEVMLINDRI